MGGDLGLRLGRDLTDRRIGACFVLTIRVAVQDRAQFVEQHVAAFPVEDGDVGHAFLQLDVTFKAQTRRHGRSGAHVVRLMAPVISTVSPIICALPK